MKSPAILALLALLPAATHTAGADPAIRPGDRVAIIGNTYADQLRVHGYLETLLLQRTRENPVSIRNLGWGADMLSSRDRPTNFPSEESMLRAHEADVIIACFGMGESFAGNKGIEAFRKALMELVTYHRGKKYNGKTAVRLILVSPIAHEDLGELTPSVKRRNEELHAYSRAMGEVAKEVQVPFVNLYEKTLYLMQDNPAPRLTVNGIHLNSYGYWAAGHIVAESLMPAAPAWIFRVDARSGKTLARGAILSKAKPAGKGIRFTVQEQSPPSMLPPAGSNVHDGLAGIRDQLIVENLAPGNYTLTIDGKPVISASHDKWAKGVSIDNSPAHRALENYRLDVNDKNLQFTYSWKALNQVHIVGERRTSPSGRSLPAEVIRFNELATAKEKKLQSPIALRTREWILLPE
jgi:hypothetical protein